MARNTNDTTELIELDDVTFDVSSFDVTVDVIDHTSFVMTIYDFMVHNLTMGPANIVTRLTDPDYRFAGFAVFVGKVNTDQVVLFHCGDDYLKAQSLAAEIEVAFIRQRQERDALNDQAIAEWQEAEAAERYGITG